MATPTYYYQDFDATDDTLDGTTWANAKKTHEGLLAVMSAGDIGVVQDGTSTDDTAGAIRTFTSPGTASLPCKFLGVKAGTVNTGSGIVESDLATTPIKISNTVAGSDLLFSGTSLYVRFHFTSVDRINFTVGNQILEFVNCKITIGGRFATTADAVRLRFINTDLEFSSTSSGLVIIGGSRLEWTGGTYIETAAAPDLVMTYGQGRVEITGVDLSALTNDLLAGGLTGTDLIIRNCKMKDGYTLVGTPYTGGCSVEIINSSHLTSQANSGSYQDYEFEDCHGTVSLNITNVRTGGANDRATGAFSYEMTPFVEGTLEGCGALKSPWFSVWISGGASKTAVLYIANSDSTPADYNEDELWAEWLTPDDADSAQHDISFLPNEDTRLIASSTAVPDDTGSSWGGTVYSPQKITKTFTPGFEGWVYARICFAKNFTASPHSLYVDPLIEVS